MAGIMFAIGLSVVVLSVLTFAFRATFVLKQSKKRTIERLEKDNVAQKREVSTSSLLANEGHCSARSRPGCDPA